MRQVEFDQVAMNPLPVHLRHTEGTDNRGLDVVVVIPVARCEWHLAVKLLKWIVAVQRPNQHMPPMIVYCAPKVTPAERDELAEISPQFTVIHAAHFNDEGYFSGANQMFKGALDYCEAKHPDRAMLWVEADCVPMKWDWVEQIGAEYRGCGQPFMGDIHICAISHMTGNAMWHPRWRKISPMLAALPGPDPEWGWDSMCADDTLTRCHRAATIQQIWRPPLPITAEWATKNIRPDVALFHQCKDGSLIDVLCKRGGFPMIPLPAQLEESTYANGRSRPDHPASARLTSPVARMIAGYPTAPTACGSVAILIVSYAKDMEFLRYCLKSIAQNCTGFQEVVVAVPSHERGQYDWVRKARVVYFDEVLGKGMLSHMAMKCRADELCPHADFIWHLDADCVVWSKVTPADLFKDGRPVLLRERYADLRNANRRVWQKNVEKAVGFVPEYETMVRQGALHMREVYVVTRSTVETHTGKSFWDHVHAGQNAFPQQFCEFCSLGAIAIRDFRNAYEMVDYDWQKDARECGLSKDTQFQYIYRRERDHLAETWSHGGIGKYKSDIEAWLSGRVPAYWVK